MQPGAGLRKPLFGSREEAQKKLNSRRASHQLSAETFRDLVTQYHNSYGKDPFLEGYMEQLKQDFKDGKIKTHNQIYPPNQ